jgi:hypothetical protein
MGTEPSSSEEDSSAHLDIIKRGEGRKRERGKVGAEQW